VCLFDFCSVLTNACPCCCCHLLVLPPSTASALLPLLLLVVLAHSQGVSQCAGGARHQQHVWGGVHQGCVLRACVIMRATEVNHHMCTVFNMQRVAACCTAYIRCVYVYVGA
jgi:hypothetical protein